MQVKEPYIGQEQVHVANGTGMRICHIGQALLPTPSSRPLHLRNILHVPDVTKNLLSVKNLLEIIMCLWSLTRLTFLSRIWLRRTYSLEVGVVMIFMPLMNLQ
jgi:hypothetical protein